MATRRRRLEPEIEQEIERLVVEEKLAPAQIYRSLTRWVRGDPRLAHLVAAIPDIRTIQRRFGELEPPDPSGQWSLRDDHTGANAELVFPVLAELRRSSQGRRGHVTRREAEWLARVRRAAPTISVLEAYAVARRYIAADVAGAQTDALDGYLAFRGWEPGSPYAEAVEKGWVPGLQRPKAARLAGSITLEAAAPTTRTPPPPTRTATRSKGAQRGKR